MHSSRLCHRLGGTGFTYVDWLGVKHSSLVQRNTSTFGDGASASVNRRLSKASIQQVTRIRYMRG